MSINENGYVISMSMLQRQDEAISTAPMTSTVVNSNYARPHSFDTMEEAINIENKSSIAYSNVNSNTDIEYIMQGNDLKENIIVKSKGERYEYGFQLALVGLDATLDESGAIYLSDKESDEIKYIIPAPYMYDAEGEYSEAVSYSLFNVEGDKYLLVVTADEEWVNDTERTFPVTIDPSVVSSGWHYDTYISSGSPTTNFGSYRNMRVWSSHTALINMLLPSIHSDSEGGVFKRAYLCFSYYGSTFYGSTTINAYPIKTSWLENSVTFNTAPTIDRNTLIASADLTTLSGMNEDFSSFASLNISSYAKPYYNEGDVMNHGIALDYHSGAGNIFIKSYECSASSAPYIRVEYTTIPDGTYYLMGASTSKFAQINDSYAPSYSTEYATLKLTNLVGDDGAYQKWDITHIGNGIFKITSAKSGKALTIKSEEKNTDYANVVQETYAGRLNQRWEITRADSGAYILRPNTVGTDDWCMATSLDASNNPVYQTAYTNDGNTNDEWLLAEIGYASTTAILEGQQTEHWCWVTAARMFAKHYSTTFNSNITYDETIQAIIDKYYLYWNPSITVETFGSGGISDAWSAINYFSGYAVDYIGFAQYHHHQICSEQTLVNFLDAGHVIYISRGKYIENPAKPTGYERDSGHATLIYGYVTIDSEIWFLIRDPDPKDVGSTRLMSYEKIYNGRECKANESSDNYVWEGFTVKSNTNVNYTTFAPASRFIES